MGALGYDDQELLGRHCNPRGFVRLAMRLLLAFAPFLALALGGLLAARFAPPDLRKRLGKEILIAAAVLFAAVLFVVLLWSFSI